jgi:glyoxylase-like metal-dependent hydrolase (beta-lactamase superfamily II)
MRMRTPTDLLTGLGAMALLAVTAAAQAPQAQATPQARPQIRTAKQMPFPAKPDWAKLEVETLPVQGQVHMIAGAGGNIAVQIGDQGVLLVDTGYEQMSAKVLAAIRALSNRTLRTVINTTLADAHTGANAALVREGRINQAGPGLGGRPNEADLIGHSNLLALMTRIGREKIVPQRWPPSV